MTNQSRWGADQGMWQQLIELGLLADLLPVVSNPGAQIAAQSTMRGLGKTPSLYNRDGEVIGIGKWTERQTTMADISKWSRESDYGICLQTRHVRALDIDVDDAALVEKITARVKEFFDDGFALRTRPNSGKCLFAFTLDGEYPKRKLQVEGGIIEFLGNGQQFIAAGTHTSGVPYEWNCNPLSFEPLSANKFEALWYALEDEFATSSHSSTALRNKRDGSEGVVTDERVKQLDLMGLVREYGMEGQAFIECPFKAEHTTDNGISSTAYFPAGSRGYEQGHFVCLHAHCTHRTDVEFEDALGLRMAQFEVLPPLPPEEERPKFDLIYKQGGEVIKVKASLPNLKLALERPTICGALICYDTFRGEIIFRDPHDGGKWEAENDERFVELRIFLEKEKGFDEITKDKMRDAVAVVAKQNTIDTAIEWLSSLEWDGVRRVDNFLGTYMGAPHDAYTVAVSRYMWSAMAGRVLVPGCQADMVPILKSPQGYKKSTAIAALAPTAEQFAELALDTKEADVARIMRGVLVIELAELRGLKTRDNETIKAFITRKAEKWVPKYREFANTYLRRSIMIATSNENELFTDTENRRWLPIETAAQADVPAIIRDRAQLWAEGRELFKAEGICWADAERLGRAQHSRYMARSAYEDAVGDWLDRVDDVSGKTPRARPYLRMLDVAREALNVESRNLSGRLQGELGAALRGLGYTQIEGEHGGKRARVWVAVDPAHGVA